MDTIRTQFATRLAIVEEGNLAQPTLQLVPLALTAVVVYLAVAAALHLFAPLADLV